MALVGGAEAPRRLAKMDVPRAQRPAFPSALRAAAVRRALLLRRATHEALARHRGARLLLRPDAQTRLHQ